MPSSLTPKTFQLHKQLEQDCLYITDLDLCTVLLMNESQFPWLILVPRCTEVTEICQLNTKQQQQLQIESNLISKGLISQHPDCKLNIASLGNVVPQLHIHHVARFKHDAAWPAPVWGNFSANPYSAKEVKLLLAKWRESLTL